MDYVKMTKMYFSQNLYLIEHKLCMNNLVSDTGSGEPLVFLILQIHVFMCNVYVCLTLLLTKGSASS